MFWGSVLALLFEPLYRKLLGRMAGRRTLAALATLALILLIVILPLALVAVSLVQEVSGVYQRVRSGQIDFGVYFAQMVAALPALGDPPARAQPASTTSPACRRSSPRRSANAARRSPAAPSASARTRSISSSRSASRCTCCSSCCATAPAWRSAIRAAIPLAPTVKARLLERFTTVIRATVKGNVLVAAAQGALGGVAFWVLGIHAPMLWAVVMAFLSLLPAVGAALIWGPVALYLIAIGQLWQGLGLIAFGVFVIGLIDNVLRPILVGKDTQLPDYVVLISTVGGMALVGLNGFVIGPLIAAMFVAGWQLLTAERSATSDVPAP